MPKLVTPERLSALALTLLLVALPFPALAQREMPASVSGRVTDGERGVAGIMVALISNDPAQRFRTTARARTDADGRFFLTNVAPGSYQILPMAPAYVVAGMGTNYPPGRPLTLTAGEEVKDIDFRVEPGGVITGRVTDADGNPVVGETVFIQPAEENQGPPRVNFDPREQQTDDRGVYRVYGLAPGRYRVSVGRADDSGAVAYGRRKLFRRTYYPDAAEPAKARVVEVRSGTEAADVDITVGSAVKTYKVAGRLVAADTGQPVPNVSVGYSTVDAQGRNRGGYESVSTTNARGEFVTDGIAPGRYAVYVSSNMQQANEFYSDPVTFELTDGDVSGLVVKVKRGSTVSGAVQIEGVADRAAAAQMLPAVRIYAWPDPQGRQQQLRPPGFTRPVNVNPDGSFQLTGLTPGRLRLGARSEGVRGLTTTRVELNGANVMNGFELAEGAQLTGLRVVMTYGTAMIVGQTSFVNGAPAAGARLMATASLVSQTPGGSFSRSVEVDARGYFRIEGLPAGEYNVAVFVFGFGAGMRRSEPVRVAVGDGGEAKITTAIDFK